MYGRTTERRLASLHGHEGLEAVAGARAPLAEVAAWAAGRVGGA
jgi:hypothetical protein